MKTIIFLLLSLTIMAFKEEMRIVPVGYEKYGETVYYSSSKMEKVDILTFEILDTLYAKDKNYV